MGSKLTAEQIQKAVDWWAKVIQNPKFDAGDPSPAGGFGMALAVLARGEGPTEDQINTFKQALTKKLQTEELWHGLDCDYHPDRILSEAAKEAGIRDTTFPWKTHMWFNKDGSVQVSYGYGAEVQTL